MPRRLPPPASPPQTTPSPPPVPPPSAAEAARAEAAAALPPLRQAAGEADAARHRMAALADGLAAEAARLEADRAACRQRLSESAADVARQESRHRDAAAAVARLIDERARLVAAGAGDDDRRRSAEGNLGASEARLAAAEDELTRLTARAAAAEAARAAKVLRINDLSREAERLEGRLRAVLADEAALAAGAGRQAEAEAMLGRVGPAEAALAAARTALAVAEDEAERTARRAAETGVRERAAAADAAGLAAEVRALAELVEGSADTGPPLIDAFAVNAGLEAAVAAGLAEDAFLPMAGDAPRDWRMMPPAVDAPPLPAGAQPLAASLAAPRALDRRLAQIGVVADRESGEALQPRLAPGQRLVSRKGDLWRWDGLTRPAGEATPAAVRIGQRQRLAAAREALTQATAAAAAAAGEHRLARTGERAAAAAVGGARAAARDGERAVDTARRASSRVRDERARDEARSLALATSRATLEVDLAEIETRRRAVNEAHAGSDDGDEAARDAVRAVVADVRREHFERRRGSRYDPRRKCRPPPSTTGDRRGMRRLGGPPRRSLAGNGRAGRTARRRRESIRRA